MNRDRRDPRVRSSRRIAGRAIASSGLSPGDRERGEALHGEHEEHDIDAEVSAVEDRVPSSRVALAPGEDLVIVLDDVLAAALEHGDRDEHPRARKLVRIATVRVRSAPMGSKTGWTKLPIRPAKEPACWAWTSRSRLEPELSAPAGSCSTIWDACVWRAIASGVAARGYALNHHITTQIATMIVPAFFRKTSPWSQETSSAARRPGVDIREFQHHRSTATGEDRRRR